MVNVAESEYGREIRANRKRLKVSLRTFAKDVGIHPTYLSKIELGHLPPPSKEVQRNIQLTFVIRGSERLQSDKQEVASLEEELFSWRVRMIEIIVDGQIDEGNRTDRLAATLRQCLAKLQQPSEAT
jgi:transcriptional regulator with XRE-family HTH domain